MSSSQQKQQKTKKKVKRNIPKGRAYIQSTYNNTIVTLTDVNGNVISWSSSGERGFKGTKKSTPYAAQIVATKAVESAKNVGLQEVIVFVSGVGGGREAAIRALSANGLSITEITDTTPIPHNGCRPKKARRL